MGVQVSLKLSEIQRETFEGKILYHKLIYLPVFVLFMTYSTTIYTCVPHKVGGLDVVYHLRLPFQALPLLIHPLPSFLQTCMLDFDSYSSVCSYSFHSCHS